MTEPKPFASLSPSLLARKGSARPAMRPQIQPLRQFHEATARQIDDDLGWNDMGHDAAPQPPAAVSPVSAGGEVVSFGPASDRPEVAAAPMPEVVRQQQAIAAQVAAPEAAVPLAAAPARPRRSALADGRRAAFTLRLDAERHLKLRLASALASRSAQQIVTEALDRLIDELPDVAELAARVSRRK